MATATKKPSTKAFVGSAKNNKKSKGLSKRLALFGLVGVLAFSTVAGFGWQKWQDHQLKAKAAGYVYLTSWGGAAVKACRYSPTSVKYYLVNGSGSTLNLDYSMYTPSSGYWSGGSQLLGAYSSAVRYITAPSSSYRPNGGIRNTSGQYLSQGYISYAIYQLPGC